MAERSYNGWEASKSPAAIGVGSLKVAGHSFPAGVKQGDVAVVLGYVAEQFNARVERLYTPGCWGYNYRKNRNANNLSCHSSGTAIDCNAPNHPNGKRGTFSTSQVRAIRAILAECGGVVQWGGDFTGTPDEMHFEILGSASSVATVAQRLHGGNAITTTPTDPEDFLMALNQMQQETVHNAVVDINNRTADMAKAMASLADALRLHDPAGKAYPFNGLDGINNNVVGLFALIKAQQVTGGGQIDVDALAKELSKTLGADLATALGKKLAS